MIKDDEPKNSISRNLAITVAKDSLELPAEILEFTIDQVVDEGILKDIPFVGWIAKGLSISQSISDRILYHKILRFLVDLNVDNNAKRDVFRNKIISDPDLEKKVGEHLLVLLNKIDAVEKASLIAKCFNCFLIGTIDHDYFTDLSTTIERSTLTDLKALNNTRSKRTYFSNNGVAVSSGLLTSGIFKNDHDEPEIGYSLSEHGSDLQNIFRDQPPYRYNLNKAQKEKLEKWKVEREIKRDSDKAKALKLKEGGASDDEIMETLGIQHESLLKSFLTKS